MLAVKQTTRRAARAVRRASGLAAAGVIAFTVAVPTAGAREMPGSFADLAERLSPAVVNISTAQRVQQNGEGNLPEFQFPPGSMLEEFFKDYLERNRPRGGGKERRVTSLGSGFVIDPSGLIVTNNHVIKDADEISVRFADGEKYDAKVQGFDPKTDLALLKIEPREPLPHVTFGNSDKMRVGDWVLAIGNPFGLGGSVTSGIISARSRDINAGPYDDFLQTDASINRGNSGGPLFNMEGEVIGINTAIYSPSGGSVGIGFAVPSTLARNVINQIKEFGRPRRGWLGVRIQTVTEEIAEGLGLKEAAGALVAGVTSEGPAEAAGIEQGDVILEFDGKKVEEMRQLPRIVAETRIGKPVKVRVWRQEKNVTLEVEIGELDDAKIAQASTGGKSSALPSKDGEVLGMKMVAITPEMRKRYELADEVKGVLVTEVEQGSAAAQANVRPGDRLVEINQEEVSAPQEVIRRVEDANEAKRKSVLVLLVRNEEERFIAIRLDSDEKGDKKN